MAGLTAFLFSQEILAALSASEYQQLTALSPGEKGDGRTVNTLASSDQRAERDHGTSWAGGTSCGHQPAKALIHFA
ncbi:MAG: hypothetical protein M3Y72_02950 [Acidobacteriota bacterium]|nr:hypothetical protein [Acidobacteriota bacterium]